MNPYQILNVNIDCTKEELKKAYHKMVRKYHPDKSSDPNSENKIREINSAYELLNNEKYRKEYDNLDQNNKPKYYQDFKNIFDNQYPYASKVIDNIASYFYNDKNEFKDDFNNFDFVKIYNKVTNQIPKFFERLNNSPTMDSFDINIRGTIYSTLENKYMNKYEKISVNRITKEPIILFVPLYEDKYLFENQGEIFNNKNGNITIDVIINKHPRFKYEKYDLYVNEYISIYHYLYGGEITFHHINGDNIPIKFDSFINNDNTIILNNMGLPYLDFDKKTILRGRLYINIKINKLHDIDFINKIKNICL